MNEGLDALGVFIQKLSNASDEHIRQPLWNFAPSARPAVIHERRVRFQNVAEDIGDSEYS